MFPDATIYALAEEIPLVEGHARSTSPLGYFMGANAPGLKVSRGLADGESVDVGNKRIRVSAVPGHTPGSAAYLVSGVLFLGDSARASKDGRLMGAAWVSSENVRQNHESIERLVEKLRPEGAAIKALAPAHSGLLYGIEPLLAFTP